MGLTVLIVVGVLAAVRALAQEAKAPLGIAMEGYEYPYPVHFFPVTVEGQDLRMAYMDVP